MAYNFKMSDTFDFKSILPDSINKLHHAYCLEGRAEYILSKLHEFLEEDLKFNIKGNPDFYYGAFETMGIDEGRIINEMQNKRAFSFPRRIFIITANFITKEAQNSLLKMFEEPSGGAVFFLLISSASMLLPTLRSRMMIMSINHAESKSTDEEEGSGKSDGVFNAKKFINSTISERLAMAKTITDQIADEKISRNAVLDYLNSIESALLNNLDKKNMKKNDLFVLSEIDKCRGYASDRSPSVKILLEHIAVIV
ncbi:MAG: hypothetical protein AAB688_01700, partial [Patescibacteria group bacterium]